MGSWGNRSTRDLFDTIRQSMPPDSANSLGDETYAAIVAYLLQRNGGTPGNVPFAPSTTMNVGAFATGQFPMPPAEAGGVPVQGRGQGQGRGGGAGGGRGAAAAGGAEGGAGRGGGRGAAPARTGLTVTGVIQHYTPVTEAVLANPTDADWLMHLGNYQAWSYSRLKQI